MLPTPGAEGVPSVGEHQESAENQEIAENVKRRRKRDRAFRT
jgi:hypothetical protein